MKKKIILLLLVIFCTSLIAISTLSSVSAVNETIKINNGMNNFVKPYSETALKGKFQLNVDNSLRAHVSISNYKKLVGLKVYCYLLKRTTNYNSFGGSSGVSYSIDQSQIPGFVSFPSVKEVKKTNKGYNSKTDFSYAMSYPFSNPGVIHKIELEFEDQPDLKLEKVSKKNGKYFVKIKNIGDRDAKSNKMGVFVGKNRIKTVTVPAIKVGKSKNVEVKLSKKFSKNKKTFRVDYNNKINEIFKNNNAKVAI